MRQLMNKLPTTSKATTDKAIIGVGMAMSVPSFLLETGLMPQIITSTLCRFAFSTAHANAVALFIGAVISGPLVILSLNRKDRESSEIWTLVFMSQAIFAFCVWSNVSSYVTEIPVLSHLVAPVVTTLCTSLLCGAGFMIMKKKLCQGEIKDTDNRVEGFMDGTRCGAIFSAFGFLGGATGGILCA